MAIDINGNCVVFNGEALCSTPAGADYAGVICHQGFCDTRLTPQQGTISGYAFGGSCGTDHGAIQKFPFSSDTNAADVGEAAVALRNHAGASSATNGYAVGGEGVSPFPSQFTDIMQKFPFTSDAPANEIGELACGMETSTGSASSINGYLNGTGSTSTDPTSPTDAIHCYPFSSDTPATDIAELSQARRFGAGVSSITHGYTAGGGTTNTIDKYPFATATPASDVGDMTYTGERITGNASNENGYAVGSGAVPTGCNINRWPFASDSPATLTGTLTPPDGADFETFDAAGSNSTTDAYQAGGFVQPSTYSTTITKFPFAADTGSTDVGELAFGSRQTSGNQSGGNT